jgi:hypothetical protein
MQTRDNMSSYSYLGTELVEPRTALIIPIGLLDSSSSEDGNDSDSSFPIVPTPPGYESREIISQERVQCFLSIVHHINCAGSITFFEWERRFGKISVEHPWGQSFWRGFGAMTMKYAQHRFPDGLELQPGRFKKPVPFAKDTAKRPCTIEVINESEMFPCFWRRTSDPDYVYMMCIHIVLMNTKSWIVRESWISLPY